MQVSFFQYVVLGGEKCLIALHPYIRNQDDSFILLGLSPVWITRQIKLRLCYFNITDSNYAPAKNNHNFFAGLPRFKAGNWSYYLILRHNGSNQLADL